MATLTEIVVDNTKVTSPPKKLNWRDHVVAWLTSSFVVFLAILTHTIDIVSQLLESVADYVLLYLQHIPRQDRPVWLAAVTFVVMGVVILNKRRLAGPQYQPPPPPANFAAPATQVDVVNDSTKSAF